VKRVSCESDIPGATEGELRAALVTLDGIGKELKGACLDELLRRASTDRAMRNLLLRIHSARVGMNQEAVCAALDGVDAFFRDDEAKAQTEDR